VAVDFAIMVMTVAAPMGAAREMDEARDTNDDAASPAGVTNPNIVIGVTIQGSDQRYALR
jgi:hypothetical protein